MREVGSDHILYFSFDFSNDELTGILDSYQQISGVDWKTEMVYIFLDEVRKLREWSSQLKLIYDAFPNLKFVVSGSASIQLESDAGSNLAGRFFPVEVPVLSVMEYLSLREERT